MNSSLYDETPFGAQQNIEHNEMSSIGLKEAIKGNSFGIEVHENPLYAGDGSHNVDEMFGQYIEMFDQVCSTPSTRESKLDDNYLEDMKWDVYFVIKTRIPKDSDNKVEIVNTTGLDDNLELIIKLNTIKQLTNDEENWHIYDNENFIELLFERQNWFKDFLLNFPNMLSDSSYEKEKLYEFCDGLRNIFNHFEAKGYKENYGKHFERIAKRIESLLPEFSFKI